MANEYGFFRSDLELKVGVLLWQVVSPVLIIGGSMGNVLSIIIMSKRRFMNSPSTVFLLALAVADLCVLYVGLLRQWVKYTFDVDIRDLSPITCKVHWWLMYTVADIAVWILPAITVERLIATICPLKSKIICTRTKTKIAIVFIVVVPFLVNSHLLYGFGQVVIEMENATIVLPCIPLTDSYANFFGKVWTWIDLCKFSLIPFAILSTGNICIVYKLIKSSRKFKSRVFPTQNNQQSTSDKNKKTSSMSMLLVGLNFMFIFCTLPVCVYFIGEPYWVPKHIPRRVQLQDPWWAVVNIFMYTNSSCNFFLYCLTGSRFRNEVKKIFCGRRNAAGQGVSGRSSEGVWLS